MAKRKRNVNTKTKRAKRKPRKVEAYTWGEAQKNKNWPYTTGRLGR